MTTNFYLSGNPVHDFVLAAAFAGCPGEKELLPLSKYTPTKLAVIFGVYKSRVPVSYARGAVMRAQKTRGFDTLVLETGYLNRGDVPWHHYAAGLNGLNGRADFRNKGMPDDRISKLCDRIGRAAILRPWVRPNRIGDVVLAGQVPWDASVDHINLAEWLDRAVEEIHLRVNANVWFRPHPLARMPEPRGCYQSFEAMSDRGRYGDVAVTFNSNLAVEAAIAGVPVFAFDEGSMALPVANRSWDDLFDVKTPAREQWLADLAYAQWTPEEMISGEMWAHLLREQHDTVGEAVA